MALVTNIPAPYRLPVYELLSKTPGTDLQVYFCSGREPDRLWDLNELKFAHRFLRERFLEIRGRFVHMNADVWAALRVQRPEVVVTTGFNPTHLTAFAYAALHGAHHIPMTDGTLMSEMKLGALHRWIRQRVYKRSGAFVGASDGSGALYRQYGVPASAFFKSQLCADNQAFMQSPPNWGEVDFIFCGRFAIGKQPVFALRVAVATARRMGRKLSILFVGSGDLEDALRKEALQHAEAVDVRFAGFAKQRDLPAHYGRASLMLFPTLDDTWGVVANEACAAGLPVITTPAAGVAGELVRDGENGRVLPLDIERWAEACEAILSDEVTWRRMSACSRQLVSSYTYANAAKGLSDAIRHVMNPCTMAVPS